MQSLSLVKVKELITSMLIPRIKAVKAILPLNQLTNLLHFNSYA